MQRTCCFGSPVSQLAFWLMIVSTAIAVLPVCRSPMISWRWPRPIGIIVDRLEAGLQGLVHALAGHHARGLQLEGSARLGRDLAQAVDRVAQRVDDAAKVAVPDGDREHLTGPTDHLALLDPGELAEHDDADLPDVEVEREAQRAVPELQQLVGHRTGQALHL